MGIFGKKPAGQAGPTPRATPAGGSLSVIGAGMTVRGDVETAGIVRVEGTVDGHVSAGGQVLVAKGGVVKGDIETREAVVGGTVNGAIMAVERVEVQAGATVLGDITTRRIAVSEGAELNGQIRMGDSARPTAAKQPPGVPQIATGPSITRPAVPIARVAVSPRASTHGAANNH